MELLTRCSIIVVLERTVPDHHLHVSCLASMKIYSGYTGRETSSAAHLLLPPERDSRNGLAATTCQANGVVSDLTSITKWPSFKDGLVACLESAGHPVAYD